MPTRCRRRRLRPCSRSRDARPDAGIRSHLAAQAAGFLARGPPSWLIRRGGMPHGGGDAPGPSPSARSGSFHVNPSFGRGVGRRGIRSAVGQRRRRQRAAGHPPQIDQLKATYEGRIQALEARLQALQQRLERTCERCARCEQRRRIRHGWCARYGRDRRIEQPGECATPERASQSPSPPPATPQCSDRQRTPPAERRCADARRRASTRRSR